MSDFKDYFDELDRAWRSVDACGGTGANEQQTAALDAACLCIEHLGGTDPALRRTRGYPEGKPKDDGGDDAYFRVYMFRPGQELSISDVADIQTVLHQHNETLGELTNAHHEGRMDAFREIGGQELVDAVEAAQAARIDAHVQKALARIRAASLTQEKQT